MKVFFDYQIFWLQQKGGISRYFCELASELKNLQDCDPRIVAPYHQNIHLAELDNPEIHQDLSGAASKLYYNRFWDYRLQKNASALKSRIGRPDILHETYYTHRIRTRARKVTTVHDMIYEKFGSNNAAEQEVIRHKKLAIEEADAIIAVSENTKSDLIGLYPHAAGKTHVVHHGVRNLASSQKKTDLTRPYILFVGNRGWYKNFSELLDVYQSENDVHGHFDLVCFGGESGEGEKLAIRDPSVREKVRFLRGNDSVLWDLYRNARVLVYNSKYEGFGMPVLEAMSADCPVICSASSSLPEVGGDAVKYTTPGNKDSLLRALELVLNNEEIRTDLVTKGRKRAGEFTWKKCAEQTFGVYDRLLKS